MAKIYESPNIEKSKILSEIIRNKVFKDQEIQEVSKNSTDKVTNWIFDFKGQGLTQEFLKEYAKVFWGIFSEEKYPEIQIGGMESGALPLIAGLALLAPQEIKVSTFYIRKSRKKSDLANLVEGDVKGDVPIVLVDDILNRGSTFNKQIIILEERGYKVNALFTCIRYRDKDFYSNFLSKGIDIFSIFELNDFSVFLPVKNLIDVKKNEDVKKFEPEYKVTLTAKINRYIVAPKSGLVLDGGCVYVGADDGYFFCLDQANGEILWKFLVPFGVAGKRIFSTPAIYKDVVIFGAYDGNLYCLNKHTGKREWVFFDADWIGSSPCIDHKNGVVFVGLEFGLFKKQGGVVAINIGTGKTMWEDYSLVGYVHASPSYCRKYNIVVCGCNDSYMYAFHAKTGKLLWKYKTEGEIKYAAVFDEKNDYVIFGSFDGGLYVLNIKDGSLYHRFEARFGFYSTPVLSDKFIIIGSLDKNVYCYNLKTKKTEWVFETAGRIFASPLLVNESVFIGSNDGRLYEIDITTGKGAIIAQLPERIVNRVQIETINNKKEVFVSTHACEVYKLIEI